LRFRLRQCTSIKRKLALAEKFSGPVRFRLRQVLLYKENGGKEYEEEITSQERCTQKIISNKTQQKKNREKGGTLGNNATVGRKT
jgi:hypothetical protein